jgi:hypothetical protein
MDVSEVNEAALAHKARRREAIRALSWEEKVELIVRMRDSLDRSKWKKPSRSSTGWSEKGSSGDTQ